jgi:hypothetical protein
MTKAGRDCFFFFTMFDAGFTYKSSNIALHKMSDYQTKSFFVVKKKN